MIFTNLICIILAIMQALAAPAENELFDKATINDVAVNSVSEDKNNYVAPIGQSVVQSSTDSSSSSIQITGIAAGPNVPSIPEISVQEEPAFKPQRVGSMFARFIDDVFQIPISVLQNVARLIKNPFTTRKQSPEVVATVS